MKNPNLSPEQLGLLRLQELTLILEQSLYYDQTHFRTTCRTPACALGHWAHNHSERWRWNGVDLPVLRGRSDLTPLGAAQVEFNISHEQATELFGNEGCGYAQTGRQAADYIRLFIARREREIQLQQAWDAVRATCLRRI